MTISVRPARLSDADAVAEVHVRSWQVGYRGLLPDWLLDGLDPARRAQRYRDSFNDPDYAHVRGMVAEIDERLVGFVRYGPYRTDHSAGWKDVDPTLGGEVYSLYVDPDHWGIGVGGQLLDSSVADLGDAGLEPIRVWCLVENERARRFYVKHGFAPDGVTEPLDLGQTERVTRLEERLTLRR